MSTAMNMNSAETQNVRNTGFELKAAGPRPVLIHTSDLVVGYNKKPLISDICFEVRAGEILTLIGPNGAGKSTILKSLVRQLQKVGGTIYFGDGISADDSASANDANGKDSASSVNGSVKNAVSHERSMDDMTDGEIARNMSIMMTERIMPELMTCRDIVCAGRYPYTGHLGILTEEDHRIVDESMALLHVSELANRDFSQISDGQRQRVMLARAICQTPKVLVMDEPTSFLDIRHKLEMLAILKDLVATKHIAVILSLHELDLAQKCSDHVLCIHNNRVDRYGTPDEIFSGNYVQELYGVERGTYIEAFGCLELAKTEGEPRVFVIGGGGSGITTYRELQRRGIPFAAGILHENDIDTPVAEALAAEVVCEKAFETIGEESFARAREMMLRCDAVIACVTQFGSMNQRNKELIEEAEKAGKLKNSPAEIGF